MSRTDLGSGLMTGSSIPDVPALSPVKRAELGLQQELSIWEIAKATFPNDYKTREFLAGHLAEMVQTGKLRPSPGWQARTGEHERDLANVPIGLKVACL